MAICRASLLSTCRSASAAAMCSSLIRTGSQKMSFSRRSCAATSLGGGRGEEGGEGEEEVW